MFKSHRKKTIKPLRNVNTNAVTGFRYNLLRSRHKIMVYVICIYSQRLNLSIYSTGTLKIHYTCFYQLRCLFFSPATLRTLFAFLYTGFVNCTFFAPRFTAVRMLYILVPPTELFQVWALYVCVLYICIYVWLCLIYTYVCIW